MKLCKSAEIDLEKIVKSHQVKLIFDGFLVISNLCVAVLGSAVEDGRLKREFGGKRGRKGWRLKP